MDMHVSFGGMQAFLVAGLFAALPTSSNYSLKAYDVGGGGGGASSSATYGLNGSVGGQSGAPGSSATYSTKPGLGYNINADVPPAPTFTNPSLYYDRLKLVINVGPNASDVKYAIAISPDNFASTTNYVKSDHSVGTTLAFADYQTYTAWGGASGFLVLGLQPSTTYTVKIKAFQGTYSGTGFGPTASAATVNASITFSVATVGNPTPPFSVSFASLAAGTVFNASDDASLTLTTNALSGGYIYLKDTNAGLKSTVASYTLASASADLSSVSSGYGAIVTSATQAAGGPLSSQAPFNGASNNVGSITTSLQTLASTSAPVTTGNLIVRLKAKTDLTIPSATDYGDVLTFVAAMAF